MLLVPRPIALVAVGVVLIQSLSMVFFVLRTPVDPELARVLGWEALPKEAPVRALALTINVLGGLDTGDTLDQLELFGREALEACRVIVPSRTRSATSVGS